LAPTIRAGSFAGSSFSTKFVAVRIGSLPIWANASNLLHRVAVLLSQLRPPDPADAPADPLEKTGHTGRNWTFNPPKGSTITCSSRRPRAYGLPSTPGWAAKGRPVTSFFFKGFFPPLPPCLTRPPSQHFLSVPVSAGPSRYRPLRGQQSLWGASSADRVGNVVGLPSTTRIRQTLGYFFVLMRS